MEASKLRKILPNLLTLCNMAIGIIVIFIMINEDTLYASRLACYLIYLAVIFDCFDGFTARCLGVDSDMGKQLDSFADIVTFGIAPSAIFISNLPFIPNFAILILILYTFAGAYRLARYNLQENCQSFVGLPITVSGFILATVLLVNTYLQNGFTKSFFIFYILLTLFLSIMMVSNFPVNRILKR